MKIAFLSSSLAPGRDGVGDYTRNLAQECRRAGHETLAVALHDRHITEHLQESAQGMEIVRFPSSSAWPERARRLGETLDRFNPDWVSLQFVPYGFNDKGFVWNLGKPLHPVVSKLKLHFMFHELWIGAYLEAPMRERIIGRLQRMLALRAVRQLAPKAVSTSNERYAAVLREEHVKANVLPLFGNITVDQSADQSWFEGELARAGISPAQRKSHLLFVIFGALHLSWPAEPLFSYLLEAGRQRDKKIAIVSVGRLGPGGSLWKQLVSTYSRAIHFVELGELPPAQVSEALRGSDFGIATSPWELIEKSGSVASILEHGLPVIVNRDDVHFPQGGELTSSPLLIKMSPELPARLLELHRKPPQSRLPEVANLFLSMLNAASGH